MKRDVIKVATIPGDGVGEEVINEAVKVLEVVAKKLKLKFKFKYYNLGAENYLKTGEILSEKTKQDIAEQDVILLGAVGDPRVPAGILERDLLLNLRFSFDQFINLRPVKLLHQKLTPLKDKLPQDIDFVVVRENTEGLYAGLGGVFKQHTEDEVAIQVDINTYKGVYRIIDYAFALAQKRKKKLVMSDKSNVLTYGHSLWQRVFEKLKGKYPDVCTSHLYIDALCMQMIKKPEQFDVIVTCNMFGDIITDLGAQIQGGMGLACAGNINPHGLSMFEPVHGSAPKYKGKNIINPMAMILTAGMMLNYLGYEEGEKIIENAVKKSIEDNVVTQDIGGDATTQEVGNYICYLIKNEKCQS